MANRRGRKSGDKSRSRCDTRNATSVVPPPVSHVHVLHVRPSPITRLDSTRLDSTVKLQLATHSTWRSGGGCWTSLRRHDHASLWCNSSKLDAKRSKAKQRKCKRCSEFWKYIRESWHHKSEFAELFATPFGWSVHPRNPLPSILQVDAWMDVEVQVCGRGRRKGRAAGFKSKVRENIYPNNEKLAFFF